MHRFQAWSQGGRLVGLRSCRAIGPACGVATGCRGVVLRHLFLAVRQLLRPQLLVVRRCVAPPSHQVVCDAAHKPAVEQKLHLVLAEPSCPASNTGPGAGATPNRSKKGLSRSTLTVGLQRIFRGSARV